MHLHISQKTVNMKRNFFSPMLSALLLAGITIGYSSCKDDDDTPSAEEQDAPVVTIDKETVEHGISTDMQSASISVPVDCEGEWHATITQGTSWVRIEGWQVTYTGKQSLTLLFDENLSKTDRKTTLNITNADGEIQHIDVVQYYNYEGQAPTNGQGLAFASKGLGTAIDYDYALNVKNMASQSTFEPTRIHGLNNVFNMTRIEELKKSGKLQASAYVEAVIPVAELKAKLEDSCVSQSKHLDVAIDLGVEFGPITVSCHGAYDSDKKESRGHVDYTIIRNAPMYNAYVSPAELATYATDAKNNKLDRATDDAEWDNIDAVIERFKKANERLIKRGRTLELNEEGLTAEQAAEVSNMEAAIPLRYDHAGIFSTNFNDRYNQLYNAIVRPTTSGEQVNQSEVNTILESLNDEFGPFIIAGGDYGGLITMHCEVDTNYLDGKASFSGEVTAEFAGYFNATGKMKYTEEGYSLLRKINPDIKVYGGSANKTADAMLKVITGGNAADLTQWTGILSDWIDEMKQDENGVENENAPAPISYVVTPIWTCFREATIQEYVRNFFLEKYKDRGIEGYTSIMTGKTTISAKNIMNANSDFWK